MLVSDDFGRIFRFIMDINAVMPTLKDITVCFNLPTDVPLWKETFDERHEETKRRRKQARNESNGVSLNGVLDFGWHVKMQHARKCCRKVAK